MTRLLLLVTGVLLLSSFVVAQESKVFRQKAESLLAIDNRVQTYSINDGRGTP